MKNKYVLLGMFTLACLGLYVFYSVLTTTILVQNLKTKGFITPEVSYRFASSTLNGQSLVLFHTKHKLWPNVFIHRMHLTPRANGISVKLQNIHLDPSQLVLKNYGAYLPDALDTYRIKNNFLKDWPLSVALFDLLSAHTRIDIELRQQNYSTYHIVISLKQKNTLVLTASATFVLSDNSYQILQATAHIYDKNLLKQMQNYALSRNQEIPDADLTYSIQKNTARTSIPRNLKSQD